MLPGNSESYVDVAPPTGAATYTVRAILGADESAAEACPIIIIDTDVSDLVLQLSATEQGSVDSAAAIRQAILDNQLVPLLQEVDSLADLQGLGLDLANFQRVWLVLGTFPFNHQLDNLEGQILADYVTGGGYLYLEGGDAICFVPKPGKEFLFASCQ